MKKYIAAPIVKTLQLSYNNTKEFFRSKEGKGVLL